MKAPVAYQGGKSRLAAQIVRAIDTDPAKAFADLCCGSGAVAIEAVAQGRRPETVTMVDAGPWGLFWQAIGAGEFSLETLSRYIKGIPGDLSAVRDYLKDLSTQPASVDTAEVFILLQAGSFGGKAIWIAEDKWQNTSFRGYWLPTATSSRRSPVNPLMPMPDTLYKRVSLLAEKLAGVQGHCQNIADITLPAPSIVYIDPPYANTTAYGHEIQDLGLTVGKLQAAGHIVYVSEGKPLGPQNLLLSSGRTKGGISGERAEVNAEWLTVFGANKEW